MYNTRQATAIRDIFHKKATSIWTNFTKQVTTQLSYVHMIE